MWVSILCTLAFDHEKKSTLYTTDHTLLHHILSLFYELYKAPFLAVLQVTKAVIWSCSESIILACACTHPTENSIFPATMLP